MAMKRNIVTPRLLLGLALIFFGAVFMLERLGYIEDAEDLIDFWPSILVLVGLGKLFWPGSISGRITGFLLAFVGVWLITYHLYLNEQIDWNPGNPWDFWPLILVLVGLRILGQGIFGRRPAPDDGSSTVNGMAVLGGSRRTSHSEDFRGGDLVAFMGGCEVDLRQARIASPPAVIDAFAMWGGIEIRVPRDWRVVTQGVPFLGGYEDKTLGGDDEPTSGPRQELVVKGFAIMGGVEIKN